MENILLLSLVEIYGDFELKKYATTELMSHLYKGLLGYAGVVYFLIKSLRDGNVMYINGMWDGVSGVLESVAAYIILGERLTNYYQYIGLVMICGGIFLLHSGGTGKYTILKKG